MAQRWCCAVWKQWQSTITNPWFSRRPSGCAWCRTPMAAWAILGLLAVGDTRSDSVARGIAYLLRTQKKDGSWDEPFFTGTGFPRVFYLAYHLYRQYFPLLALTTYAKVMKNSS